MRELIGTAAVIVATSVFCLTVAACNDVAPAPAFTPTQPFTDADFVWSTGQGTATVSGQAFLKTVGGDVKTCAGNQVGLIPDNPYTEEINFAILGGQRVNYDLRYARYQRTTTCDAEGRFTFSDLPAGKWFVKTIVVWGVPSENGISPQGGGLIRPVETKDGTVDNVILTDRDEVAPASE